nr:DUF1036 domain-containing protein [uncultured Cohaesibacter sp.]
MPKWATGIWFFLIVTFLLCQSPAQAQFAVCNQSLDVFNIAIGQEVSEEFQTDGWWTVGANKCATVIRNTLTNRYIYVYATDVKEHPVLTGTSSMCIDRKRFTIRGATDCWERGHIAVKFHEVDTKAMERWTLFLQPDVKP